MSSSPPFKLNSNSNNHSCFCSQGEISVSRTLANTSLNANLLANTLGVSPLYRQQE